MYLLFQHSGGETSLKNQIVRSYSWSPF